MVIVEQCVNNKLIMEDSIILVGAMLMRTYCTPLVYGPSKITDKESSRFLLSSFPKDCACGEPLHA